MTDSPSELAFHIVVYDLGEAAELLLDRCGLTHQNLQNAVFRSLGQREVVAADFLRELQLAIDPTVALLYPSRIPR